MDFTHGPEGDDERAGRRPDASRDGVGAPSVPCSQCGGPVPLEDGVPWVTCSHCRVPLAVDVGRLLIHGVIRPVVRERDVVGVLERWLRLMEVDADVVAPAAVLEFRPYYFVSAADGSRRVVEAAPDVESPDLAAAKSAVDAGRVEPFSAEALGDADAVLPVLVLDDVIAAVAGPRDAPTTQVRLVHLPVWRLRYRVGTTTYSAVVDGVLGAVTALVLPPAVTASLDRSAVIALSCAIVGSTLLAFWASALWTIAVYIVAAVVAWVWTGSRASATPAASNRRDRT